MRTLRLAGLFFAVLLATTHAEVSVVTVGGTPIRLPAPPGFLRYDGQSKKVDRMQAQLVPASNRLLAAFGDAPDVADALQHKFPRLVRTFNAQTHRESENIALTADAFAEIQRAVRLELAARDSRANPRWEEAQNSAATVLAAELGSSPEIKLGELAPFDLIEETPESICFSALIKTRTTGPALDISLEENTAVATCVMEVRGRLLYLLATAEKEDQSDVDWTREQIIEWRNAVLAANAGPFVELPFFRSLPLRPLALAAGLLLATLLAAALGRRLARR